MIIEEALFYHLTHAAGVIAIAGTRGYPGAAPQEVTLPCWEYQRISGIRQMAHGGPSGLASARFQITITAETYASATALANAIRQALDGYRGTMGGVGGVTVEGVFIENDLDGYNQLTGLQTIRQDYLVMHQE